MLTAHNGQLASFVCVMSYVFKFSIAYIHVYNDEKKPWTVMVRGFSCTFVPQKSRRNLWLTAGNAGLVARNAQIG